MNKPLYSRYPIAATMETIMKYHKNSGINLEIRNTDKIMHKPPAYLLNVYLIFNPPITAITQKIKTPHYIILMQSCN